MDLDVVHQGAQKVRVTVLSQQVPHLGSGDETMCAHTSQDKGAGMRPCEVPHLGSGDETMCAHTSQEMGVAGGWEGGGGRGAK